MKISELPIEETYGYDVFLGKDGNRFNPKQKGDEWLFEEESSWNRLNAIAETMFMPLVIYRRRIDIGEGYRLVGLDERIQIGDWVFGFGDWSEYSTILPRYLQEDVRTPRGEINDDNNRIAFRRKIEPQAEPVDDNPWRKIVKGQPETLPKPEDYPVEVWNGERGTIAHHAHGWSCEGVPCSKDLSVDYDKSITNWKRWKPSAPPPPEKTECEKAFEAWRAANNGASLRKGFAAGYEAGRKAKA